MDVARTASPCQVHRQHQPLSHINEKHHVWPQGDGGPTITTNLIVVCATGHNSIHQLLDQWRKAKGDPGWSITRHYAKFERHYAELGWRRLTAQSMNPPPLIP